MSPGKEQDFPSVYPLNLQVIPFDVMARYDSENNHYPVVILMEQQIPDQMRQRFLTYAFLEKDKQNHLHLTCLKQKMEVHSLLDYFQCNGKGYVTTDVFGIHESCLSNQEANKKECVVCLTETINTMIIPCKHMCLCEACCEDMRARV